MGDQRGDAEPAGGHEDVQVDSFRHHVEQGIHNAAPFNPETAIEQQSNQDLARQSRNQIEESAGRSG